MQCPEKKPPSMIDPQQKDIRQYRLQRLRRGFTLVELAIVLGITGIVLAAIWTAASAVSQRNHAQQASQEVLQILNGYKKIYGVRGEDTGAGWVDVTCLGAHSGAFPADMIPKGCDTAANIWPQAPWAGSIVSVRADSVWNGVLISYWGLSAEACVALASAESNNPGLLQSAVGIGNSPNNLKYPPYGNAVAMTLQDISGYCSPNGGNEVTFEYAIK
jgi:prepilin-type N-terminal cleavage/methylation domain-containing protein